MKNLRRFKITINLTDLGVQKLKEVLSVWDEDAEYLDDVKAIKRYLDAKGFDCLYNDGLVNPDLGHLIVDVEEEHDI